MTFILEGQPSPNILLSGTMVHLVAHGLSSILIVYNHQLEEALLLIQEMLQLTQLTNSGTEQKIFMESVISLKLLE